MLSTDALKLPLVSNSDAPANKFIHFTHLDNPVGTQPPLNSSQAYNITISAALDTIHIETASEQGAFYGVQTLLSLAETGGWEGVGGGEWAAKAGRVGEGWLIDGPRFELRGMHVDVCRNFHSGPTEIRRLLDAMARYKLNVLHFHLADDEGWRLEIPEIPELTEVKGETYFFLAF